MADIFDYRRQIGVEVADPYKQQKLMPLEQQDVSKTSIDIENSYLVSSEKVFCHICGSRLHNRGFTGITEHGYRILFGSHCAKEYFLPEVLKAAEKKYNLRLEKADADFKILQLKATARQIEAWLDKNKNAINKLTEFWEILFNENSNFIDEVFEHLDKNNNRLTEQYEEMGTAKSAVTGKHETIVSTRIVTTLGNHEQRKAVKEIRDNANLVRQFIASIGDEGTLHDHDVVDVAMKIRTNLVSSAKGLDNALLFSAEFLKEGKLKLVGKWSDDRRDFRLRFQSNPTRRNIAKVVRKRIGFGIEPPNQSLIGIIQGDPLLNGDEGEIEKLNRSREGQDK